MQCTTVEGVQVDVSIGSDSGLKAAAYMSEKVFTDTKQTLTNFSGRACASVNEMSIARVVR